MTEKNVEQILREKIDNLQRDKMPSRDLWPGIEMALSRQHKPRWPYWLAAASIVVAVGLSWHWQHSRTDQFLAQFELKQKQQLNALLTHYQDQPALTENWQQQMDELNRAAQSVQQALRKDPNNINLLRMLKNIFLQQIDLIERVHTPKWPQRDLTTPTNSPPIST